MIQIATYGPKVGRCNACGEHGPLTEDHTPPKGCHKPTQVQLRHLTYLLSGGSSQAPSRLLQNGVKYRTLCHRCNNTLLGANYDPAFIDFVNAIATALQGDSLPSVVSVEIQPQAVVRSLIGHMSAQGVDRYEKGAVTEPMRDYFLDRTRALPDSLRVYFWLYPFRQHVMFRDAAYADLSTQSTFAIWLLKFYPVAFALTFDDAPLIAHPGIQSFDQWRDARYEQKAAVSASLRVPVPQMWPEAPTPTSMFVVGQEAVYATPR